MSETTSHFIFPTYTGTLNMAVQAVIARFNEGSDIGTWIALETLYRVLVPKVKKEVKQQYEDITEQIGKVQQRMRNSDPLVEQANQSEGFKRIYRKNNGVFFENIMQALHDHGYLERIPRKVPISVEPGLGLQR